jgi:hypothetical protein
MSDKRAVRVLALLVAANPTIIIAASASETVMRLILRLLAA